MNVYANKRPLSGGSIIFVVLFFWYLLVQVICSMLTKANSGTIYLLFAFLHL